MEKLKISFEIVKNYDRQEFRDFIRKLSINEPCDICKELDVELFIITQNTDQNYVFTIAKQYNIPSSNIFMVSSDTDRNQVIIDNNIEITFENDQSIVNFINSNTEAISILVDSSIDFFLMGFKYISKFNNVLKIKANEKKENC